MLDELRFYDYSVCKYVTRLLEIVYPEMAYTDDVKMKDVKRFVCNGAAFGRNFL